MGATENITATTATVVATVVPSGSNTTVSFSYKSDNSDWVISTVSDDFDGTSPIKVTFDLTGLQPNTLYKVKATAVNDVGSVTSTVVSFTTAILPKPVAIIGLAEKVGISTATINAVVVPNQNNTIVSFEYQTGNSSWTKYSLPSDFSGTDSVKVAYDLANLQANSIYNFRVIAGNIGGQDTSAIGSFMTYAVADYDGNLYHTVTVGNQTWLKENFRGVHFANGDPISNVTDMDVWKNLNTPAYCWYNNDLKIGKEYGALYNFYVGIDPRGLIAGYHVPSAQEQIDLRNFLDNGDQSHANSGLAIMEAGYGHWNNSNRVATNSSGFTLLPGGYLDVNSDHVCEFFGLKTSAALWSNEIFNGFGRTMDVSINLFSLFGIEHLYCKESGLGLRLIRNN